MKEQLNFKKNFTIPFTQIPNEVLYDPELSLKAKALWAYLNAKPEGWNFSTHRIAEECKDGRRAVLSGLKELKDNGYLESKKQHSGRVLYILKIKSFAQGFPQKSEPKVPKCNYGSSTECKKTTVQKSHSAETAPIINKESNKKRDKEKRASLAGGLPARPLTRKELLAMEYSGKPTSHNVENLGNFGESLKIPIDNAISLC